MGRERAQACAVLEIAVARRSISAHFLQRRSQDLKKKNGRERPGPATMPPPVDLDRRQITALTALALLGGATITITGCGGGGGSSPAAAPPPPAPTPTPATTCAPDSACGQVAGDPTHRAEITAAQLSAGGALVLDIKGSAVHSHTVSLSTDEVVAIREKRRVEKNSSTTLSHVTFN
jgi:hypothetical protein